SDRYPGARMCTGYDVYVSVVAGVISSVKNLPRAWVFHPSWKAPLGDPAASAGLGDNCAGYSYDQDDRGWSGLAMSSGMLVTARYGVRLSGGPAALCSSELPIACCRRGPEVK